jgi:hypothetical protein
MRLIYIANRGRQYDSPASPARAMDPGATLIAESRAQVSILFGVLTLAFAAALATGVTGAQSGSGRVATAIFCGLFLGACLAGWVVTLQRPTRLEVSEDAIRYVRCNGQASTLTRQPGDELCFVKYRHGRIWTLGLCIAGTETIIFLCLFSRSAVRQACLARGWRFDR